jgi:hypothetical protein
MSFWRRFMPIAEASIICDDSPIVIQNNVNVGVHLCLWMITVMT